MTTEPLLQVRDLRVAFRRGRRTMTAVDGTSFELQRGETLGLVGESGSGKSTIANAILGLVPTVSGEIRFADEDITHLSFKQRRAFYRSAQIVFQDPYSSFNPVRTIGRTLAEPLQALGEQDKKLINRRVRDMLERVGLAADTADRYPRELSGGQRQRVAIARALMPSPQLVICDEATSALDLSIQAQVLNLLQDLQASEGLSYLFVSHDLEVVRHMCDHTVVLYQGRVMESGPADAVFSDAAHPYTEALHHAALVPDPRVQRARHVQLGPKAKAQSDKNVTGSNLCPFAPRCAYAQQRCWEEQPLPRQSDHPGGFVACHRFPEWRVESAAARAEVDDPSGLESCIGSPTARR